MDMTNICVFKITHLQSPIMVEIAKLRALRAFAPLWLTCLTRIRALRAFVPYESYVPYSHALSTRLARLFQRPCTHYFAPYNLFIIVITIVTFMSY